MGVKEFFKKRSLKVSDSSVTRAAELTVRESLWPITLVTLLFFLWGFSYGLLDTLNKHFQNVLGITQARSAGLQAAYFGAYPIASIGHASWILRHYGYRAVFIWGLCLYGLGALLAIPAVKAKSFGGFCVCIFIIGNGLGSLETAANPFITLCGPPRYSEMRINFSQAFNGIGTVIAPVIGSYVFFDFSDDDAVENVQWVYLAIAAFVLMMAVVFFFSKLPEITDADMAYQVQETHADADEKPFHKQYKLFHASFAQFCYTGSQIALASFFINYATATRADTDDAAGAQFLAGAQAAFSVGRFIGALIMRFVRPRIVFLVFLTLCIAFMIPAIVVPELIEKSNVGVVMLYMVLFFESICFPTIIALGLRGLGRHTKRGSGYIVGGVSGGAAVPAITGVASDRHGNGMGLIVPLIFFVAAWTYPLAVNFVPSYTKVVDSFNAAEVGLKNRNVDPEAKLAEAAAPKQSMEERAEFTENKADE
ncbi:MFS transporter, FHS family, L-fucose permease [Geosmithia morbida]|uniref:MFS transporter, FHS family, L-fucose permease n=1 Tax=Geosmithia morbida TaxID=1094350 RepID=A0A9P4YS12_9HYPO|nr:MFS transporter, FHS family, L-fucose permease [Geosmithia morbida]KAF4121695.1 MFS transporter, FHS family, L-fucose permease [Geosmithia morbida]